MKKLTVWVLALVLFSCGTKEILSPDLSKDVTGVYQVYLIGNGVKTISMPTPTDTISIALQPIDKQRCSYSITLKSTGEPSTQDGIFELKKSVEQTDLYQDSKIIGFVKNNELIIDYTDDQGVRSVLKARK